MTQTTIYLIRHCEYENPQRVVPGRMPGFPLSIKGKKNAKLLANYFKNKKIVAVYSSPILRTKQTAEIIASELNLKVLASPLLKETKSPYQGISLEKFFKLKNDVFFQKKHIEGGGESIEEIKARMKKFINEILEKHYNSKVIIVSHGDPIMIYTITLAEGKVKMLKKRKDYVPKGGIFKLVFNEDKKLKSFYPIDY
ncbi:histidine phosphatase family protein [Candidatus Microgenomates bacterium]|nr:histidine phosphatase family protein [Candidatus Microgenomates bacterium]